MGKNPQTGIESVDVAGQGGPLIPPILNTSAEHFLTTVDDHETIIETRTCLALAKLYDEGTPGVNNFEVPWDWRNDYEKCNATKTQVKQQDDKATKGDGDRTNEGATFRQDVEDSS